MARKKLLDPIHPGEILLDDFMKPMGLSINRLARDIVVPPGRISAIVNGKRSITADTALRLSKYLARIILEDFYCNRRYATATSLTAGGLAAQSVNILFQVCLLPSRLRAPVSRGVSAVSSRTLVNNAGL